MSHIVTIQTEIRDRESVDAACRRLRLPESNFETIELFSDRVAGYAVRLPDWRYPVVCDLANGHLQFDNFHGVWGNPQELHRFIQAYAVERARLEARKNGHTVTEEQLTNGSIKLTIQVGGTT